MTLCLVWPYDLTVRFSLLSFFTQCLAEDMYGGTKVRSLCSFFAANSFHRRQMMHIACVPQKTLLDLLGGLKNADFSSVIGWKDLASERQDSAKRLIKERSEAAPEEKKATGQPFCVCILLIFTSFLSTKTDVLISRQTQSSREEV